MDFNDENKVIIDSMNKEEAKVFIKFLKSEIIRHRRDIKEAENLIYNVVKKFELNESLSV